MRCLAVVPGLFAIGCAHPAAPAAPGNAAACHAWEREPAQLPDSLACVGPWRGGVWAETSGACGHALERVGTSWIARPDVANCYQRVPESCRQHGEWPLGNGATMWIGDTGIASPPRTAADQARARPAIVLAAAGSPALTKWPAPFARGDVWGRAPSDVFAVGEHGAILHFDGAAWRAEPSGTAADLVAVAGRGDQVFAVAADGTVVRRRGDATWVREATPTSATLRDVEVTGDGWFAVGDGGVVLRREACRSR